MANITCVECGIRDMKISFSENPMMVLRGAMSATPLCRQCYIELIEKRLKEIKTNLKEQKDLLRKELWKEKSSTNTQASRH